MSTFYRKPEAVRLPLAHGHWLLVKKFLTAGETRRIFRRMMRAGDGGRDEIDALQVGLSKLVVYLLDWSVTDADDQPVLIRGLSESDPDALAAVLNNLDAPAFADILHAVEQHEEAVGREREEEKKILDGGTKSDPTWPSLEPSGGAMSGWPN